MPIIGVIIVVIIAVLVFRSLSAGPSQKCRWKIDKTRPQDTLTRYVCQECGVDAYTSDARPPKNCKKQFRTGQL